MTTFANPLARKQKIGYPEAIDRIKLATRAVLKLSDDVVISVTELTCREPGCPDIETVVAIFQAGHQPLTVRFHVPIPKIAEDELTVALLAVAGAKLRKGTE